MIYVVLSLGKSGSSLLAETLHKAGIPAFEHNSTHNGIDRYEDEKVCDVNRDFFYPNHQSMNITYPVIKETSPEVYDRMKCAVRDGASQYKDYCIKDPRMAYTYHLWEKVLPEHKLIIQFRNPSEVCEHYVNIKRKPGIPKNISDRYMHVYLKAMEHSNDHESLFISHCSLLNFELDKLAEFTGCTFEKNQAKELQYRCRNEHKYLRDDTRELFSKLIRLENVW